MTHKLFNTLQEFTTGSGKKAKFYSLPELEKAGIGAISRLPVSIRIVLESVLRNCDGARVEERNVRELAAWQPQGERTNEVPFVVARVLCKILRVYHSEWISPRCVPLFRNFKNPQE